MEHLELAVLACGLLGSFAGIVGTWTKMKTKLDRLQEEFNQLLTQHNVCSSTQQERWQETSKNLTNVLHETALASQGVQTEVRVLAQQLQDYIKWRKNGGDNE